MEAQMEQFVAWLKKIDNLQDAKTVEEINKLHNDWKAYHKGSCDIVPQAPFFVKPGTFDGFSTGNRLLLTG